MPGMTDRQRVQSWRKGLRGSATGLGSSCPRPGLAGLRVLGVVTIMAFLGVACSSSATTSAKGAPAESGKKYPVPSSGVCKPHYVGNKGECTYQTPVPVTMSIGINPGSPALPVLVAQQEGYFKEWGITAHVTDYANLGLIPEAVIGGSVDLGESSEPPLIQAAAKGIALVTPANLSYALQGSKAVSVLMVMKSSGIKSVAGLAGPNNIIAAQSLGANLDIAVHDAFREAGVTGSRLPRFVTVATTAIVPELVSGQVQAVEIGTPYIQQALGLGAVSILDVLTVQKGLQARVFLMGKRGYVLKNKVAMAQLRSALSEADGFIANNPAQAKVVLQHFTGLSASIMSILVIPTFTAAPSASDLSAWVKVMKQTGYLANSVQIDARQLVAG